MMESALTLACEDGLATLTISRPAAKNSLKLADMKRLGELVDAAAREARCLVICGSGGVFCAGRDLAESDLQAEDSTAVIRESIHPSIAALHGCPIPTIAAVEGPALGFGLGIALACDLTFVADDALLGSPFRRIGCVPDSGAHWFIRERIGRHRALELIFGGRLISGREAAAIGLVNRSVGRADLQSLVSATARQIAAGPTLAFGASKRIIDATSLADTLEREAVAQGRALRTADGREGISAFLQKRQPVFRGA